MRGNSLKIVGLAPRTEQHIRPHIPLAMPYKESKTRIATVSFTASQTNNKIAEDPSPDIKTFRGPILWAIIDGSTRPTKEHAFRMERLTIGEQCKINERRLCSRVKRQILSHAKVGGECYPEAHWSEKTKSRKG